MKTKFNIRTILLVLFYLGVFMLGACKKKEEPAKNKVVVEYKNDSWKPGDALAFQSGFVVGEAAAVILGPFSGENKLKSIAFMFGGSVKQENVTLKIYKDGGNAAPGLLLADMDFVVNSSNDSLRVLDISSKSINLESSSNIRVAIFLKNNGQPSVARDDDGNINNTRNWIFTGGNWVSSSSFGITGDWIIRAQVETEK